MLKYLGLNAVGTRHAARAEKSVFVVAFAAKAIGDIIPLGIKYV